MKKKICAGLVLFAVAGALIWSLATPRAVSRLADGSFIAVNSVSLGTNHPTRWGGVWRDYARKGLPARYANRLAPSLQASRWWPTNCTAIWFRHWRPDGKSWPISDMATPYDCVLLDERGQVRASSPVVMATFSLPPNVECRALAFAVLPPMKGRQTIRIQRKDQQGSAVATNPPVQFVVDVP